MITITINKKKYRGIYNWKDITLEKFSQLSAIPIPEKYEAFILADGKFEHGIDAYVDEISKIGDYELNIVFPDFYKKVILCLTNIPESLVNILTTEQVNDLYDYYFKPFILTLIYHIPVINFMAKIERYQPEDIKSFRIGFHKYYLPKTVRLDDQDIELFDEPVISYLEAADLFRGIKITKEDIKRLSRFMAIYCRRKGEQYDESRVLERQNLFMKAPMSVVWSVFFYTSRRLTDYTGTIRLFSQGRQIQEVVQLARLYKNTVTEPSSTRQPVTED
jgi:hypothetical protein